MDEEQNSRLRRAVHRLARAFGADASAEGLTPSQASALGLLVREGPLTLSELTAIEGLNPTMVSRIVARLESLGLATRQASPSDQRVGVLEVTPLGRELQARIRARRAEALRAALAAIGEPDRRAVEAALPGLEALADALREDAETILGRRRP